MKAGPPIEVDRSAFSRPSFSRLETQQRTSAFLRVFPALSTGRNPFPYFSTLGKHRFLRSPALHQSQLLMCNETVRWHDILIPSRVR